MFILIFQCLKDLYTRCISQPIFIMIVEKLILGGHASDIETRKNLFFLFLLDVRLQSNVYVCRLKQSLEMENFVAA